MVNVKVTGGELTQPEIDAYIAYAEAEHPDKRISGMDLELDGDFVNITYHWETVPFERIRRITGYLVGTLERFNNAKRAEVNDRLCHNT